MTRIIVNTQSLLQQRPHIYDQILLQILLNPDFIFLTPVSGSTEKNLSNETRKKCEMTKTILNLAENRALI